MLDFLAEEIVPHTLFVSIIRELNYIVNTNKSRRALSYGQELALLPLNHHSKS